MQKATIQSAAENQGHALLVAEERKFAAHGATCQAAGISFLPLAIETLGGLSDTTVDTISSIGRLIGQRFGISPPESSRQLGWLSPSGEGMLLHGFIDARHPHLIWMAWSESPFAGSDFCLFFCFLFFLRPCIHKCSSYTHNNNYRGGETARAHMSCVTLVVYCSEPSSGCN